MDVVSTARESFQEDNSLSSIENSKQQNQKLDFEHVDGGSVETMLAASEPQNIEQLQQLHEIPITSDIHIGNNLMQQFVMPNSGGLTCNKSSSSTSGGETYLLRSSLDVGALKNLPAPSTSSLNPTIESQKRRRGRKRRSENVFLSITKRCGYLLTRMSYEQSLIVAYSGEGWNKQSQDKVKPEKELQRATSEILRCKLEIRDLFKNLDNLCAEGRLHESLFDSEGQIYSEDIFCAKCGSKDSSANNDIILCDGICSRGFHQMCLVPPLRNEDIPPGDESWLCPGCVCKVACIEKLNELQGTKLSIHDKWEKVFPEAATTTAGDMLCDELPSDDSKDDDYNPQGPSPDDNAHEESSSSDESDFTSASDDDSDASTRKDQPKCTGLSSDDSEDNDYDPDVLDVDKEVQNEGSVFYGSDFTSDSEDLSALRNDGEPSGTEEPVMGSGKGIHKTKRRNNHPENSELPSVSNLDSVGGSTEHILGKRCRQQLDYKKLHDEEYGGTSSDSSDDEDWNEMRTLKREMTDDAEKGKDNLSASCGHTGQKEMDSKMPESINDMASKPNSDPLEGGEIARKRRTHQKLENEVMNHSVANSQEDTARPYNSKKASASGYRRIGQEATQKLHEFLMLNNYPTREMKEDLSKELGMTVQQVSRWFENARRSLRLSINKDGGKGENGTANNVIILPYV